MRIVQLNQPTGGKPEEHNRQTAQERVILQNWDRVMQAAQDALWEAPDEERYRGLRPINYHHNVEQPRISFSPLAYNAE